MHSQASSKTRTAAGQFAPGVSGNPAGRPKGSRNRATLFLEALRDGEGEAIARLIIAAALAGEKKFLLFCANHIFARPRGRAIVLDLPEGLEGDTRAVLDAALRAMGGGEVSPQEALDVARLVQLRDRAPATDRPVSGLYPSRATEKPQPSAPAAPAAAFPVAPAVAWESACKSPVSALAERAGRPLRAALLSATSPMALAA
jgi:hypothetical protein